MDAEKRIRAFHAFLVDRINARRVEREGCKSERSRDLLETEIAELEDVRYEFERRCLIGRSDPNAKDIFFDLASILCSLAEDYTGEAKSDLVKLAERLETEKGISDEIRTLAIRAIGSATSELHMGSPHSEAVRIAATIVHSIYDSIYFGRTDALVAGLKYWRNHSGY